MKYVFPFVGVAALSACMTPVAVPTGTIPFSQVLAETADRPYECVDYEERTNSCAGYSTHEAQGEGRYIATSVVRLSEEIPTIQATYVVVEQGLAICSVASSTVLQFTRDAGLNAELRLATLEREIRELEDVCYAYSRTAGGYRSQVVSGSDRALEDPISDYRYFSSRKLLRVAE